MNGLDLTTTRKIHVLGAGGAGMSAIATVLHAMGHIVSGSDLKDSAALERLRRIGVVVAVGHDAANLGDAEVVAISSAITEANIELSTARARGLEVFSRAETLAAIAMQRRTIAISGTHGKTTTSSMLALILTEAGLDPSFLIGGEVNEIGTNAVWGEGEWLVVEADESDGTFLTLDSEIAVVTSVEPDHLEYYGSMAELEAAFGRFLAEASSTAVVCADDLRALNLAPEGATSYGFAPGANFRIIDFESSRSQIRFGLERDGIVLGDLEIPVPGEHNARNAVAAIAVAEELGLEFSAIQRGLARFAGVARRFEFRGEANGVSFVDDYAHLPGEVAATLATARSGGWQRVICVFQPHRYSRVASLARDFADAFVDADVLVLTSIYSSGEAPRPGISSKLVLNAVLDAHPQTVAAYLPQRTELISYLRRNLRPGDCCLTLSAGDLTTLPDELLADPTW